MSGENEDAFPCDSHVLDADLAERSAALQRAESGARGTPALHNAWSDVTRITTTGASSLAGEAVRFFDGYEVLEELARGGMGVVYKARRLSDERLVAVKMILAGQFAGEADLRRFRSESEAVSRLDHPGIVPIFDVGEFQGRPYFSMELIEGRSLAQLVEAGPLAPRDAAEMVRRIAEAVHYAHERGVVHRDLKPKNILLDDAGRPKITDFGLAKRLNHAADLTATGEIVGTPSYMPPEQAVGDARKIGPTSDVYSLGAMLYCLLTGRPPFLAPTWIDTLLQVRETEPAPPSLLQPTIPASLEAICLKCLEKDPARRYPSARGLAEDLAKFLADAPTAADRPRQLRRSYRVAGVWAALATSVALAVGVIGYGAWNLSNAIYEARDYAARAMENALEAERRAAEAERRAAEIERRASERPAIAPRIEHQAEAAPEPAAFDEKSEVLNGAWHDRAGTSARPVRPGPNWAHYESSRRTLTADRRARSGDASPRPHRHPHAASSPYLSPIESLERHPD